MIRRIKVIRNVGTFESESGAATLDLKRLSLIYAENGRGKTTLSAILRSLKTGNPLPIMERQRLGSDQAPYVVLESDNNPKRLIFETSQWNSEFPNFHIFDDTFIDENVYSGLDVSSQHRQGLHDLILGEQGVSLSRRLDGFVSRITEHNTTLSEKAKDIPDAVLGGLSVEEFCDLPISDDIDAKIDVARLDLNAARDRFDTVQSKALFQQIKLPEFDLQAIEKLLATDLDGLDKSAEARVQEHVLTLVWKNGEEWVSEGVGYLNDSNSDSCPFCGQDITGRALVNHYRAYCSEG